MSCPSENLFNSKNVYPRMYIIIFAGFCYILVQHQSVNRDTIEIPFLSVSIIFGECFGRKFLCRKGKGILRCKSKWETGCQ